MKRREFYYVKKYREDIEQALQEILYDLDCDMPAPEVKIILYADDKGNVEVQPENFTGNDWPMDDEHTLHVVDKVAHGSWMMYWDTMEDIAMALDITEDELVNTVAGERMCPAADLDLWDVIKSIANYCALADWRDRLIDVYREALKENYWQEYGDKAHNIVDAFIKRQEMHFALIEKDLSGKRLVAQCATMLLNQLNPARNLEVTYNTGEDEMACNSITNWAIKYHGILPHDEYFWIYDRNDDDALLYVVDVSADSVLAGAYELYRLIMHKF